MAEHFGIIQNLPTQPSNYLVIESATPFQPTEADCIEVSISRRAKVTFASEIAVMAQIR